MQFPCLQSIFISTYIFGGALFFYQFQYFQSSWYQVRNMEYRLSMRSFSTLLNITNSFNQTTKARKSEVNDEPNFEYFKGRFDKSRKYRIYEWVWTSKKWDVLMQTFNVCLATQTSIEKVFWILEVVKKWQGPISAAVYLISQKEFDILKKFIVFAQKCSPDFVKYVTIHIALPANVSSFSSNYTVGTERLGGFHCNQTTAYLEYLVRINTPSKFEIELKGVYPQNHMRNIARKTCGTDWVYSSDVDLLPSENAALKLQEFYKSPRAKTCKNCAYVIPSFELQPNLKFPKTKMDLITYVKERKACQLHIKYHETGHKATDYAMWMNTSLTEGPVHVSHAVKNSVVYYYEPFYIAPDSIPEFDERFVGYGYTRNSQIDEAMILGWNFSVLTPIFGVHWGMKVLPGGYNDSMKYSNRSEASRDRQDANNFIKYIELMKELELKKGLSGNRSALGYDLRMNDKRSILVNLLLDLRSKIRAASK